MKKNRFFGIATLDVDSKNEEEAEKFLLDNGVLVSSIPATFVKERKTNEIHGFEWVIRFYLKDLYHTFSYDLMAETYHFLLDFLKSSINTQVIMKNREFDIENFGLSEKKIKNNALKIYNKLFYKIIDKDSINLGKNNSNRVGAEKRLISLNKTRDSFIDCLNSDKDILYRYLIGDSDFFNRKFLEENILLQKIYKFESKLAEILELNRRFQFEDDDIFTAKPKFELIYEEFKTKFDSIKQVEFIEKQLSPLENRNRAYIVSLFYFFKDERIKKPSLGLFREIIIQNFGFDFGRLQLSDPQNYEHKNRVNKIKDDWINFIN